MTVIPARKINGLRAHSTGRLVSTLLFLLAATFLLAACSNNYAWVRKDNMDWAQKYVETQHAEKQDLMAQQEQFAMILERLNTTLARNVELEQAITRLNQTLTRPLRLETTTFNAPMAASEQDTESSRTEKPADDGQKMLVGSVETAWFPELDRQIESRIDTGATTSSINVTHYEVIERDGEKWVRFSLPSLEDQENEEGEDGGDADNSGDSKADPTQEDADKPDLADERTFEKKLIRRVSILQSSTDEKDPRPVIRLRMVIGGVTQEAEFTLADRGHLSYDALIGRNALRDLMIVDVSREHATRLPDELKE